MPAKYTFVERLDKALSGGLFKQLLWLFAFVLGVLVFLVILSLVFLPKDLSIMGFSGPFCRIQAVLYHFLDPGNIYEETTAGARFFTTIVAVLGMVLMGGLLVTTFSNIVDKRVSKLDDGKVVYKKMADHYIIIGYGSITASIIRSLKRKDAKIVLMTSQSVRMVRSRLFSSLSSDYEQRIYIYAGNIESEEHLMNLNFHSAIEVYVLGENSEQGRDSKNLECVRKIAKLRGHQELILPVHVQMDKLTSYSTIQKLSLSREFLTDNGKRTIYFRPFNFYENWSRILWGTIYSKTDPEAESPKSIMESKGSYSKLDYETVEADKYVHLVIVGFANMGQALFFEALRQCHYPNYYTSKIKTRITVIDWNMDVLLPSFQARFPYLEQIEDVSVVYKKGMVEDPEVREYLVNESGNADAILTVAICLEDPDISLSTGLSLPDELYYRIVNEEGVDVVENSKTRILIRQSVCEGGMARLLGHDKDKYRNVSIFGMADQGVSPEMMDDDFAMYINASYALPRVIEKSLVKDADARFWEPAQDESEAVKMYREALCDAYVLYDAAKDNVGGKSFIDVLTGSDVSEALRKKLRGVAFDMWLGLAEPLRFANRYQVDIYDTFAKYYDVLNGNRTTLSSMEHRRWLADRTIVGYRAYNPYQIGRSLKAKKDIYKFHHCIRPFDELAEGDKNKDTDTIDFRRKLTAMKGYTKYS